MEILWKQFDDFGNKIEAEKFVEANIVLEGIENSIAIIHANIPSYNGDDKHIIDGIKKLNRSLVLLDANIPIVKSIMQKLKTWNIVDSDVKNIEASLKKREESSDLMDQAWTAFDEYVNE